LTRAVESPLVRGGLTIGAGLLTGNIIGFARVALTAYLLGTHSRADSLAVALGPIDTLNSVLINSMVFGFVPMLTARQGVERTALFLRLRRNFFWVFSTLTAILIVAAPQLMAILAPGLDPAYLPVATRVLRILSVATLAAGMTAIHCALLYTDRRFAPTAFYQASLNLFTIAGALALWNLLGVYGFAIGYTVGAWAQYGLVHFSSRSSLATGMLPECRLPWRELVAKPAFFLVYAAGIALNITFTRAYATHAGPGMAAALEYCLRGVGVPLAILVNPMANSLLPEIARLRSLHRIREAFRLIDKTIALAALLAVLGCGFALLFREPAIRLLFERGSFTPESTLLVSAVFLGLGPAIVGWSLTEITSRSLFALDRPLVPLAAAAIPVLVNAGLTFWLHDSEPHLLGIGASAGLIASFTFLFVASRARRKGWYRTAAA
jgi:putative peptidoglycan lipid II flippase